VCFHSLRLPKGEMVFRRVIFFVPLPSPPLWDFSFPGLPSPSSACTHHFQWCVPKMFGGSFSSPSSSIPPLFFFFFFFLAACKTHFLPTGGTGSNFLVNGKTHPPPFPIPFPFPFLVPPWPIFQAGSFLLFVFTRIARTSGFGAGVLLRV